MPATQAPAGIWGYAAGIGLAIALTFAVAWLRLPPFVFEHVIVLLVVAIAIRWRLGAASAAAITAIVADNLLLREPIGSPAISGARDLVDLLLFGIVAVTVSGLVTRAQRERERSEAAAARERLAREERDRLIATVSHDLATPLAVLANTVHFVRHGGARAEQELPRLLTRLETATARAVSLVRTLADARALEARELRIAVERLNLTEIVSPLVEMLDRYSERHPVVLSAPDTPVVVDGDADRLRRVVENLVSNAIKYSPDGGPVELTIEARDGHAIVQVRDYGIGISDEARPHVFERSYRAREASGVAPGLGLGLSIAAQVAALHRGVIELDRPEGPGTIVRLVLPLASAARAG